MASIADLEAQATPKALAQRSSRTVTGFFHDEFGGVAPERVAIVGAVVVGVIVLRLIVRRRRRYDMTALEHVERHDHVP